MLVGKISPHLLEGVPDVLAKELFLASGEGPGLANVNPLIRSVQELRDLAMSTKEEKAIKLVLSARVENDEEEDDIDDIDNEFDYMNNGGIGFDQECF
ncbi:hypothetical protein DY000_02009942 [Brassica cretica]|uniref:Uncharacterized protein n=1 Tax=Brassica cretica TaxID=69181 RepID=A0ABQ7C474_BRACR|nr:hypothetical protein DY000_02009942 [Brassica cretica]